MTNPLNLIRNCIALKQHWICLQLHSPDNIKTVMFVLWSDSSEFKWLLLACQTAMTIVSEVKRQCLNPYMRCKLSALLAHSTGLSAGTRHSLVSSSPHPSPHVPQRDKRLFLRILWHPGWLQLDWLQPGKQRTFMAHADWAAMVAKAWLYFENTAFICACVCFYSSTWRTWHCLLFLFAFLFSFLIMEPHASHQVTEYKLETSMQP